MKIQKLPPEARRKLESGVIITDAVQCVLELVRNSLDADASGIAVRVNLKNFQIKVIDNGKGIEKGDLKVVGERFMTSKYQSLNIFSTAATYGYKGQALSSMLDFCRSLTIQTKSDSDGPTLVKAFVKGKAGQITELNDTNCGTGTTVVVEDFMYTMPVRRKRIKEVYEMEEIKTQLQYLALIHYKVCFTLRNDSKGLILLQTPQASSMLEIITNLYGKKAAKDLKLVKYEENYYSLRGYASIKASKQNNMQIVYVNRQVIAKGVIHKFINYVMKDYRGSKTLMTDSPAGQILKKLKNLHYMFIVEINCPHDYYEPFTNLRKTTVKFKNWKDVLKCIHKGLKKAFKFDCEALDESINHLEEDAGNFGTSVLMNAVKGVPAARGFKIKRDVEESNREVSKKVSCHENNQSRELSLVQSEAKVENECTIDSLETPIPKNKKPPRPRNLNCSKSQPDTSYIEFYNWLKASFKTDATAFYLYSEFLRNKKETAAPRESCKSPVLGVKLNKKRLRSVKSKVPEKQQKMMHKSLDSLNEEISFMMENSLKIFPNGDLRVKKAVQFNTETRYDMPDLSNFDCENLERKNNGIFKKPMMRDRGQKQIEVPQTFASPALSDIHFTNIMKFRNLSESFHFEAVPVQNQSCTNSWMSHYKNGNDKILQLSNSPEKFFKAYNKKKCKFRDVTVQTISPEIPKKMNAMVQTTQAVQESNFNPDPVSSVNEIPVPEFWNASTPENNTFCELNKIICNKTREQRQDSSEFICSQKPKSHSNPKSNPETQTLLHLWTDSLSEFGNPSRQDLDTNAVADSFPKTIPLEEICSSHFCLTERHDFVPKGLSPKVLNCETVEIPNLDPCEKNRIQLTIDDVRNDLLTVKWQDESTGKCTKPTIQDAAVNEVQLNGKRKFINFESQILSTSLSYCAVKVHNLLHSFTFTKELLSTVEVLGQLDEKFIVTKMKLSSPKSMELISLLDQHAVDERVRLERIINEYIVGDKFVSTALSHSLKLTFSESQVQIIIDLKEKLLIFGFDIEPLNQNIVLVKSVPSYLLDKYKRENKKDTILEDISQSVILGIVNEVSETRGAVPKVPKIMHGLFCSEACHGAIKFNRALEKETMAKMINNLKNCKLPFQCAHGRPSVIPIIDLEDFRSGEEEDDTVDLQKVKKFYNEPNEDAAGSTGRD